MGELKVGRVRQKRNNSVMNGNPSIIRTHIELELSQVCIFHAEGLKVTSRKSTTAEQRITLLYLLCARAYANYSNHIRRTVDVVVAAVGLSGVGGCAILCFPCMILYFVGKRLKIICNHIVYSQYSYILSTYANIGLIDFYISHDSLL